MTHKSGMTGPATIRPGIIGAAVVFLAAATLTGCSEGSSGTTVAAATVDQVATTSANVPGGETAVDVAVPMEGIFPVRKTIDVGGVSAKLRLTGQAVRKAMMIKFYQIASYCEESHSPAHVDELAATDCSKQLCLTMVRDVPKNILERSFREALEKNDPEGKFGAERDQMLAHMLKTPLCEGESVLITHIPNVGMACSVRGEEPVILKNLPFAHMVWNVYMGPQGVCKELRRGLGEKLAAE